MQMAEPSKKLVQSLEEEGEALQTQIRYFVK